MSDCPYEVGHPSQAQQLHGIGPKLSARLEARMTAYCKQNNVSMPARKESYAAASETASGANDSEGGSGSARPAKRRKVREYTPHYRSGAYAILVAMTDRSAYDNMVRADIVRLAAPLTDASFEVPGDAQGHYTAWNSMATLVEKELVTKFGSPAKYTLTEAGMTLSKRLREKLQKKEKQTRTGVVNLAGSDDEVEILASAGDDMTTERDRPQTSDLNAPDSEIVLQRRAAGTYTVQLVIDNREVKTQRDRDFVDQRLDRAGIVLNARTLDVGDAVWIARCEDGSEIVLDYIVERKRLDDLVGSIKDGRFKEQKYRLGRCGCKNVMYIIEDIALSSDHFNAAIKTSLAGAQVNDGCFVKRVKNLQETVDYLIAITKKLESRYASIDLYNIPDRYIDSRTFVDRFSSLQKMHIGKELSISYSAFAGVSRKRGVLCATDVWLRQLLCIRGLSLEKALEVRKHFPLLLDLLKAYRNLPSCADREALLSSTCTAYGRKSIGKALSKKVYAMLHDP